MIRERYNTRTYSQDHAGVDFAMCISMSERINLRLNPLGHIAAVVHRYLVTCLYLSRDLQILWCHAYHDSFLFFGINVLHAPISEQASPTIFLLIRTFLLIFL